LQPGTGFSPWASAHQGVSPYVARARASKLAPYAGFWPRFAGQLIDCIVLMLITVPIQFVLGLGALWITASMTTCIDTYCAETGLIKFAAVVLIIIEVAIVWRVIVRPQVMDAQTYGMRVVGLEVRDASTNMPIGTGKALIRSVVAPLFLAVVFGFPFVGMLIGVIWDEATGAGIFDHSWVTTGTLSFAMWVGYLPWLWNVVDRRRQTLADKLSGTVVVLSR
jgi:uncharacterized RDD family membrane protein YckC